MSAAFLHKKRTTIKNLENERIRILRIILATERFCTKKSENNPDSRYNEKGNGIWKTVFS